VILLLIKCILKSQHDIVLYAANYNDTK